MSNVVPKVSVQILTYNHRPYIAKALDTVLAQQTNFPIEVVVGDDASTDGTQEVLREYALSHPHVRLLLQERNLGSKKNYAAVTAACRGDYIAFLDGDDWWTVSTKLQLMSDYLDVHPNCPLACHYATFDEADSVVRVNPGTTWISMAADRLLLRSPATTSTCMIRRRDLQRISDVPAVLLGDKARAVALAHRVGPIACLPLRMTVRRIHDQGVLSHVWSMRGHQRREASHQLRIDFLEKMDAYTDHAYSPIVARPLARLYYAAGFQALLKQRWRQGWRAFHSGWHNLNRRHVAPQRLRACLSSFRLLYDICAQQVRLRLTH